MLRLPRSIHHRMFAIFLFMLCVGFTHLIVSHAVSDGDMTVDYQATLRSRAQVYDGDTISTVRVRIAEFGDRGEVWPGIFLTDNGVFSRFSLRIAGIDTPERRPRKTWPDKTPRSEASRLREKALAMKARTLLTNLLVSNDNTFIVRNPMLGKYAGRVVCEVYIAHPEKPGELVNVADVLIDAGLAKPYQGGTKPRWD